MKKKFTFFAIFKKKFIENNLFLDMRQNTGL